MKMNQDCFMQGNPIETGDKIHEWGVKRIEDCMRLCLASSKCQLIDYVQQEERCILIEQDLNEVNVDPNDITTKYASTSCIMQSWYKKH